MDATFINGYTRKLIVVKKDAVRPVLLKEIKEVVFHFVEGENQGVEIRVSPPRELFIGRGEECDIFLGEKKISRKHSKITVSADALQLTDLQSTNGTFLNSKKITEFPLHHEDKIRVGSTVIQVMISAEASLGNEPMAAEVPAADQETGAMFSSPSFSLPSNAEPADLPEPSGAVDIPPTDEPFAFESAPEIPPEEAFPEEPPPPVAPKPLSGNLSAMGLADLLQNLAQNQKSGILHLHGGRQGLIWISGGKILGAEVGGAKAEKAIYRMLGWNEGSFELSPLPDDFDGGSLQGIVTESVEGLLLEGFRQFDELEKIKKGLPPISAQLKMKPKFTAPLSKLHPRVLDVLQVILNEGTYEAVLDQSPLSDLETSKVVFYLIKKDYVVAE